MAIQSNVTNGAVFFTPVSEIRSACVLARYLDVRFTSAYTMQNVFAERSPWHTPWKARGLPAIEEIVGYHAKQSVFTRFIPPAKAAEMQGTWQRYFCRW